MCNYFPLVNFKFLSPVIFFLFTIFPGHSQPIQGKDTLKLQSADTFKLPGKDTLKLPGEDTLKLQSKDTVDAELADSVIYKKMTFRAEELVRGERLFFGLVYQADKSINCGSCHNTRISDTLNWNPDALEISKKYLDKSAFDLSQVLLNPPGQKMKLVHKDFQLSASDIVLLKAYMNRFVDIGLTQNKPIITNLILLIIAAALFLFSTIDLIIKRTFKNPRFNRAILTVTGIFISWILVVNAIAIGRSTGFSPDQPVKFSHAVHAGQNKTDCIYCHYSANTSKSAGIPSGSICMNCHFLVRTGTRSGVTEITKVIEHFDSTKAIDWIRIYKLPDFTFFSHAQHVNAGKIECATCHGDVKVMDRLSQVNDLSMGWCIDCHDSRKVNLSNEYYKGHFAEFYDAYKTGKIDSVMVTGIGGRDCGKCHY